MSLRFITWAGKGALETAKGKNVFRFEAEPLRIDRGNLGNLLRASYGVTIKEGPG